MNIAVLILAAGNSSRMRQNKALLTYDEHLTFLDQLINQYSKAGVNNIHVISQHEILPISSVILDNLKNKVQFLQNNNAYLGRSYSIHMGLKTLSNFDYVFIQNIDNPFTDTQLITSMVDAAQGERIIIPIIEGRKAHPILLPKNLVLDIIQNPPLDFDFKACINSYPQTNIYSTSKKLRANINTLEDYQYWINQ